MMLYLFTQWYYFIRKRRPVSYGYSFEDLLALLHGHAPAKVDAVARHRRRVEHGRLSVGLKIHCLGDGSQFSTLVEGLGGAQKILDVNYYKHSHASLCLVLPPVDSARSAILLLKRVVRESELQGVWSAYPGGPAAISHRPDPIMIVAAPSLVVELARTEESGIQACRLGKQSAQRLATCG